MAREWLLLVRGAGCALALLGVTGCGGAAPPVEASAPPPSLGPLVTLVPGDSTLVVVARPAELMDERPTRRVVQAVLPSEQLDQFAQRTGVDPRRLSDLVVAQTPSGWVVLARGAFDAELAVREAGARMAPVESSDEHPVRRVGFLGERRVDVSVLGQGVVSWVDGTPQLAASVLAAARMPLGERPHPLRGTLLGELRRSASSAPFAFYVPQPLDLPRDAGVGVLLARERALAVSVRPRDGRILQVNGELRGEFPPGAQDNFRALARAVAESDLGAALGVGDALPSLRVTAEETRVDLQADVDASVLASGLRVLFVAELREILNPVTGGESPAALGTEPLSDETPVAAEGAPRGREATPDEKKGRLATIVASGHANEVSESSPSAHRFARQVASNSPE